jgi:hypothetical protein
MLRHVRSLDRGSTNLKFALFQTFPKLFGVIGQKMSTESHTDLVIQGPAPDHEHQYILCTDEHQYLLCTT